MWGKVCSSPDTQLFLGTIVARNSDEVSYSTCLDDNAVNLCIDINRITSLANLTIPVSNCKTVCKCNSLECDSTAYIFGNGYLMIIYIIIYIIISISSQLTETHRVRM